MIQGSCIGHVSFLCILVLRRYRCTCFLIQTLDFKSLGFQLFKWQYLIFIDRHPLGVQRIVTNPYYLSYTHSFQVFWLIWLFSLSKIGNQQYIFKYKRKLYACKSMKRTVKLHTKLWLCYSRLYLELNQKNYIEIFLKYQIKNNLSSTIRTCVQILISHRKIASKNHFQ